MSRSSSNTGEFEVSLGCTKTLFQKKLIPQIQTQYPRKALIGRLHSARQVYCLLILSLVSMWQFVCFAGGIFWFGFVFPPSAPAFSMLVRLTKYDQPNIAAPESQVPFDAMPPSRLQMSLLCPGDGLLLPSRTQPEEGFSARFLLGLGTKFSFPSLGHRQVLYYALGDLRNRQWGMRLSERNLIPVSCVGKLEGCQPKPVGFGKRS